MTTVPANVQLNKQKSKWTIGQIVLVAVIFVFVLTCVLPFLNVIAISFSSKSAILRGDATPKRLVRNNRTGIGLYVRGR